MTEIRIINLLLPNHNSNCSNITFQGQGSTLEMKNLVTLLITKM